MIISHISLKNWKNFKQVDIDIKERAYILGNNASGKSNFLDVLRFLRDIVRTDGGGLQKAIQDRGGLKKIRCLSARGDSEVEIKIQLSEHSGEKPEWEYLLAFKQETNGRRRVLITKEEVIQFDSEGKKIKHKKELCNRPNKSDIDDSERLTQTHLEQINENKEYRTIVAFLSSLTYLHLVPQLLKYGNQLSMNSFEADHFGQSFLETIAKTPDKTRISRLKKVEQALSVCVPNMKELKFVKDKDNGAPHLEVIYKHWRPNAGQQREDQFSDGTLRLLGIMWSLLDGNSLLLLEEPELSLNDEIVKKIPLLIDKMQKSRKQKRQVFVTTHSRAMLEDKGIDPLEVIELTSTNEGTTVSLMSEDDKKMIDAGYSIAEIVLPKLKPNDVMQLDLIDL